MNTSLIKGLKTNWFSIRVIMASLLFSVITFGFCYLYFNYSFELRFYSDVPKAKNSMYANSNYKTALYTRADGTSYERIFSFHILKRK